MVSEEKSFESVDGRQGFCASSLSTCDFSTIYTTLPHNLIKGKLVDVLKELPKEKALFILLQARRNEKELIVKPATSFQYFQYLLTKN